MRVTSAVIRFLLPIPLMLLLSVPLRAEEAGAANKPGAAADAAASTKPAGDEGPGEKAVRAARAFLAAVGKSDDKAAYALTTPEYQQAHSPEQFAAAMAELRKALEPSGATHLQGTVTVQPAEGEPREARLFSSAIRGRAPRVRRRPDGIRNIGIQLLEREGGGWLVAEVRGLDMQGMREFNRPVVFSSRGGNSVLLVSSALRGVVSEVNGDAVTIRLYAEGTDEPHDPPRHRTLKLTPDTSVMRATPRGDMVPFARGGGARPVPVPRRIPGAFTASRIEPGTAADVKVDREVTVHLSEDDGAAVAIDVVQPAADADGNPGL